MGRAVDFGDVAQEPARQIDQMNPLIDQLAAAGDARVRPPLLVVADAPAMAVAGPQKHQGTEGAGIDNLPRLAKCPVIAMVEADMHEDVISLGQGDQGAQLADVPCRGLFRQHMLAGGHRRPGDLCQGPVRRGDDDERYVGPDDGLAPIGRRDAIRYRAREIGGPREIGIGAGDEPRLTQRLGPLPADQPASDDRNIHRSASPAHSPVLGNDSAQGIDIRPRQFAQMSGKVGPGVPDSRDQLAGNAIAQR